MSAYIEVETEFRYTKELVEALQEIYGKNSVEIHEKAKHLYGYEGDKRRQKANIIVRRKNISLESNDLGFIAEGDRHKMIVSEYDQESHTVKIPQLVQTYAERVIKNRFPRGKYRILKNNGEDHKMKVQVLQC